MTQEEKLKEAKRLYETANADQRYVLESLFPELVESEDERIRKNIISWLKNIEGQTIPINDYNSAIDWLEKQGEKPIGICSGHAKGKLAEIIKDIEAEPFDKYEGLTDFERTLADICIGWIGEEIGWKTYIKDNADILLKIAIEKFNSVQDVPFEQKPTNKVEPKFKVGDEIKTGNDESLTITKIDEKGYWSEDLFICSFEDSVKWKLIERLIDKTKSKFKVGDWICNDMCDVHIASIENGMYYFDEGDGLSIVFVDEHYHLWTIEDAKAGDILVDVYGNIGIFQKNDDFDWTSYCSLGCNGGFQGFIVEHEIEGTHPATKEQCDLLFQKMHEAGYEWSAEKKVIKTLLGGVKRMKKIEQKPTDEEMKEALRTEYEKGRADAIAEMQVAWSEEDELSLKQAIYVCHQNGYTAVENWLKSLKQRIGG